MYFVTDDPVGARKSGIDRRLVADLMIKGFVAGIVVPHQRRTRRQRGLGGDDRRQYLVVDVDKLGRVLRLVHAIGNDKRNGFADIAHPLLGEERLRAHKGRAAVAASAADCGSQAAETPAA